MVNERESLTRFEALRHERGFAAAPGDASCDPCSIRARSASIRTASSSGGCMPDEPVNPARISLSSPSASKKLAEISASPAALREWQPVQSSTNLAIRKPRSRDTRVERSALRAVRRRRAQSPGDAIHSRAGCHHGGRATPHDATSRRARPPAPPFARARRFPLRLPAEGALAARRGIRASPRASLGCRPGCRPPPPPPPPPPSRVVRVASRSALRASAAPTDADDMFALACRDSRFPVFLRARRVCLRARGVPATAHRRARRSRCRPELTGRSEERWRERHEHEDTRDERRQGNREARITAGQGELHVVRVSSGRRMRRAAPSVDASLHQ